MTLKVLFLVISLIVSASRAEVCPSAQGDNWVVNDVRCFRYVSTPMSWKAAQRYCSSLGFAGSLAVLDSDAISDFARTAVPANPPEWIWLGITDVGHEGEWKSLIGETINRDNQFRAGQPDNAGGNEHHVHISGQDWDWNDAPEGNTYPFLCQAEPAEFKSIVCPQHWAQHGDLCYKYVASDLNWYDAQERCELLGNDGMLAFVGSEQDNNNVFESSGTDGDFWIGLTDLCHEEQWSGPFGKRTNFLKWRPNEPNDLSGEDCVHMTKTDREWNDLDCGQHKRPFVCQKSARFDRNRCPPGLDWVQRGDNCYRYYKNSGTWQDALGHCRDLGPGGTLPFVGSEAENDEVYQAAARSAGGECDSHFKNFWIGITDEGVPNAWTNPDGVGSLSNYNAWAPNEPNNGGVFGIEEYVEMLKGSGGLWNDENGSEDAFVCRLPAESECNTKCPEMWTAYNGACYLYNGAKVTLNDAKTRCEAVDAALVSKFLPGSDEHRFLGEYIFTMVGYLEGIKRMVTAWVDLNDLDEEGKFVWGDGSNFDGVVSEIDNRNTRRNCVVFKRDLFIHDNCINPRAFICKKPGL